FNNTAADFNRSNPEVLTNSSNLNTGALDIPPSSEKLETITGSPYLSNENLKIQQIVLPVPKFITIVRSPHLQLDKFNIFNQSVSADLASAVTPMGTTDFLKAGNINPLYFNIGPENFEVKKIHTVTAVPISDSEGDVVFQKILSSFTTVDINTIHTPFDKVYHQRGYEQTKFGFGGGIAFGLHHNRWTVEGGMVFSMKQYNPRKVLEIFRFNSADESAQAVSLSSIELNTLTIPLNIRYDLARSDKKLIPYFKMGVGLNLATHANYQRDEYKFLLAIRLPGNAEINLQEEPRLNEKKFTDGLLQGGSFQENHYLSLNTGLGLDYSLSKQWRLFTQVGYNFNALEKKLGPNEDHINTVSLQLGFRHLPAIN
nr:outer membrane beta-barrel protein [Saprospiraceae bacterium]